MRLDVPAVFAALKEKARGMWGGGASHNEVSALHSLLFLLACVVIVTIKLAEETDLSEGDCALLPRAKRSL